MKSAAYLSCSIFVCVNNTHLNITPTARLFISLLIVIRPLFVCINSRACSTLNYQFIVYSQGYRQPARTMFKAVGDAHVQSVLVSACNQIFSVCLVCYVQNLIKLEAAHSRCTYLGSCTYLVSMQVLRPSVPAPSLKKFR